MKKILTLSWIVVSVLVFLYSFTQVDLGLTLTRASVFQVVQTSFQYIGYFNRPLSTYLYIGILIVLFVLYCFTLWKTAKGDFDTKSLWRIVLPVSLILLFSYSAFSHDIFNYIFDARIVTDYQQNPYVKRALDFPQDPMLSFMHWTHRTYPYGPVWLIVTVPLAFLSLGKFIVAFYLFKLLMVASYIGSVYFLGKLMEKVKKEKKNFVVAFFALNPLVIIESTVSAHNDIFMMFVAVLSLYLLFSRKIILSFAALGISIAVKFATAFVAPFYLLFLLFPKSKAWFFEMCTILMTVAVIVAANREQFQPWYLLFVIPFAAVISYKKYILIPSVVLTFGALLKYIPYLYTGNWNDPIPLILNYMYGSSIAVALLCVGIYYIVLRKK